MNKIYKVVWSKVKHCYVVTSELAKRNTKGCGARSLRMAAVSVGVAAALIGGVGFGSPVAEAADPVISGSVTKGGTTKNFTQANFTYESGGTTYQNDYGYANTFFDGESATPPTEAKGYAVNITSAPNWRFFVGAGIPYGTISDNSVTVNGDSINITREVIGGSAYGEKTGTKTSTLTKNSVTVNGGTLNSVTGANMGGYVAAPGTASENTVTINAGLIKGNILGAFGYDKAEENKVYIKGGTVDFYNDSFSVTGGESGTGTASNNEVIISDGTAGNENGGGIRGGMSWRGQANENKVTISGGTVKGVVYGGMNNTVTGRSVYPDDTPKEHTPLTGTVSNNKVIISDGTVTGKIYGGLGAVSASGNTVTVKDNAKVEDGSAVYGGSAMAKYVTDNYVYEPSFHIDTTIDKVEYGTVTGNTVNIEDSASITGEVAGGYNAGGDNKENKVYVKGGTATGNVYGARINSTENTTGNMISNEVHISKGTITGNVYGGSVEGTVTGDVKGNKVEITGGTIQGVKAEIYDSEVYGGYTEKGMAGGDTEKDGNSVTVKGGTVYGEVCGGYAKTGNAKYNTTTMSDGIVEGTIIGGWAYGDATYNTLTVTGGTMRHPAGGYSYKGNATYNTVNFGGTATASQYLYGGQVYEGNANNNTVNITGGTIKDSVSGGYSNAKGVANGNTVNITGGTITFPVNGGRAYEGNANNNTLNISGTATIGNGNYAYMYGGWSDEKAANDNIVTVSGGTVNSAKGAEIYGGYSNGRSASTTGNTVNLTGTTTGLENTEVYGGSKETYTGNELHVGGTKDGSLTGAWTGSSNNTVKNVANFETIVFHSINWNKDVAALEAKAMQNYGTLDITKMSLLNESSGSMDLLKAGNVISGITLKYNDGAAVSLVGNPVEIGGGGAFTDKALTDNLKVTGAGGGATVSLAEDNKAIVYSFSGGQSTVSSATMTGSVAWDAANAYYSNTGYTFNDDATVNLAGLTFSGTVTEDPMNTSMALINGKVAGTLTQPTDASVTVSLDKTNTTLGGKATGTAAIDGGNLKYTLNAVALDKITVKTVGNTADAVPANWTLAADATVETDSMTEPSDIAAGTTKEIIKNGSGGSFFDGITINGKYKWKEGGESIAETTHKSGVVISEGTTTGGGVKVNEAKDALVFTQSSKSVTGITLGGVTFADGGTARSFDKTYDLTGATVTAPDAVADLFTADSIKAMGTGNSMTVIDAVNAAPVAGGKQTLKAFDAKNYDVDFSDPIESTVLTFAGKHTDTLALNGDQTQLVYTVGDKNVTDVKFDGEVAWSDSAYYTNDAAKYKFNGETNVDAAGLTVMGSSTAVLKKGDAMTLLSAEGMKANITAAPVDVGGVDLSYTDKGISFTGKTKGEVKAADNAVKYEVTGVGLNSVDIGEVTWQKNATLVDNRNASYDFTNVKEIGADSFAVTYADGVAQTVVKDDSMTLLAANNTLTAMVAEEKAKVEKTYSVTPVEGVTVNAKLTSNVTNDKGNIKVTATSNQATELKFEKVEWTGDTALIDHSTTLKNVSFDGATVDTSNIDFYKEMYIEADQTMTLVSNFGGEAKVTPESTKYMVGTAYEGESETKMEGDNLIIRTKTAAGLSEQTHKTVMAMEAGMALLAGGTEHMGKALESLSDSANQGSDGTSVGVSIGGAGNRYETGSHVNVNSWNAALAIGAKRELKQGSLEYGVFGEYGKGSYKLYNDDGGKGDGDAHYAGGGLMAKWTNSHDVYTEASFRLGRMSDSADNILEGGGNKYGYDVHANYYGAHVGIGKVFKYKGGKSLDVYGKYFYTKRDGVEYDAKQHYNLDAVASSVLRIGARYGSTDKLWNWYGGLAYEYEFDGEAKGTVNGTAIRAASIRGSSVRGELGMKMSATKDNPWQADISIYGYGGKHRGFGGSVNVAYTF